ncbi:2Fe-2S iron-sulfur cluster-binding protein [Pelagibius sp.]|uniref:2Fe-2S iron-sulfur cluster-binding protein n=1 Tax=Pelagibius sp. TaxID=1931238 RepID=UPI003B512EF7
MPRLTIRQWPLPVETGRATLLDAALSSGAPFPHGCRTGECGACKSLLLSGEVTMAHYDREILTDAERNAGFILACRARPQSDVHISWMGGSAEVQLPIRRMSAQVTNIERVSPTVCRLYVWPEEPLEFAAGQFVRLRFAGLPARAYSMANTPGDEALEFHVRVIPGGAVSEHIDKVLKVGDRVQIEGPFGNAHLRPEDSSPLVLVAGSSGLAPAKSIMRTALRQQPDRRVHLYFGVRSESHVYDESELQVLVSRYQNLKIDTVLSEPEGRTSRRTGTLADVVAQDLVTHTMAQFYMAGPPPMVSAVSKVVTDFGIRRDQIHADPFHAGGAAGNAEEPAGSRLGRVVARLRGLFPIRRGSKRPDSAADASAADASGNDAPAPVPDRPAGADSGARPQPPA